MRINKLVVASHNQGKIDEIKKMLEPFKVEVISAKELNLPDVEETGTTFAENAKLKAETLSELSGLPCLADDSGLCINALNGRPGVFSARYAPNRDFGKGMEMLLKEMQESESTDRSAYFACVLALKIPGEDCRFYEGRVNGKIAEFQSGDNGFGYDPIFIPEGFDKTFGHFEKEEKAEISHRGRAFQLFCKEFLNMN